jgi:hypothetical protein
MNQAADRVKRENSRVAKLIGINKSARTTTVKPAGTTSLTLGTLLTTTFAHGPQAGRRLPTITAWSGFTAGQLPDNQALGCAFKKPINIFPTADDVFESVHWQSHDNCTVGDATCAATQNAPAKNGAESTSEILNDLTIFGYEKQRMKVNFDKSKLDLDNYRYYFLQHESDDTNLDGDADVRHESGSAFVGADMNKWTEICPNADCNQECSNGTPANSEQEDNTANTNSASYADGGFFAKCTDRPSEMTTMRYSCYGNTANITNTHGVTADADVGANHDKSPWTCYEVDATSTAQPFSKVFHIGVASRCGRLGGADEIFMWASYSVEGGQWQVTTAASGAYSVSTADYTNTDNDKNGANEVIFVYGAADTLLNSGQLTSTSGHTESVTLDYGSYATKCHVSLRWATSNNSPTNPDTNAKGMGGDMTTVWHTPHACTIENGNGEGTAGYDGYSDNVKKNSYAEVCRAGLDVSCGTLWTSLNSTDSSISTRTGDTEADIGGTIPTVYYATVVVENTRTTSIPRFAFESDNAFEVQALTNKNQAKSSSDYASVTDNTWYTIANMDPFAILSRDSGYFTVDCKNTIVKGDSNDQADLGADTDQSDTDLDCIHYDSNAAAVTGNNTLHNDGTSDDSSTQTFMDVAPVVLIQPKHGGNEDIVFSHVYVRGILTVHADGPGTSSSSPDATSRTSHDYNGPGASGTGQDPNTGPETETTTGNGKDVTSRRLGARNSKPLTATKTAVIGESYGSHRGI